MKRLSKASMGLVSAVVLAFTVYIGKPEDMPPEMK